MVAHLQQEILLIEVDGCNGDEILHCERVRFGEHRRACQKRLRHRSGFHPDLVVFREHLLRVRLHFVRRAPRDCETRGLEFGFIPLRCRHGEVSVDGGKCGRMQ
jgi:hypothetical protein